MSEWEVVIQECPLGSLAEAVVLLEEAACTEQVVEWVSVVSAEEPPVLDLALHLLRHPML